MDKCILQHYNVWVTTINSPRKHNVCSRNLLRFTGICTLRSWIRGQNPDIVPGKRDLGNSVLPTARLRFAKTYAKREYIIKRDNKY
ncbi:hypothetical protein DPMN_051290 [Dreissena polymorpha]|uniref:Uncharacterized protein n=1 Tax=Dreissena polymorpha TaxID=45954 RepID=A0A9D4CIQ8_DREPO|nr:hypothetical protein DPMN_051290 [Dreissena polymorpha]